MAALFNLTEKAFDDVGCSDELPVLLRKVVESQAGFQIAVHAFDGARVDFLIPGDESSGFLVGLLTAALVEDRFQLRSHQFLLLLRDIARTLSIHNARCVDLAYQAFFGKVRLE